MTFDEIKKEAENLSAHDKLILAQIMLQMAIREQENKDASETKQVFDIEAIKNSLSKLKPGKLKSLQNSIKTLFNFKGGISDNDVEMIVKKLQKSKFLKIDEQNKVDFL